MEFLIVTNDLVYYSKTRYDREEFQKGSDTATITFI